MQVYELQVKKYVYLREKPKRNIENCSNNRSFQPHSRYMQTIQVFNLPQDTCKLPLIKCTPTTEWVIWFFALITRF